MTGAFDKQFDQRPWGTYTVLDEGPGYKVKRIEVSPQRRLSSQRHTRRAEHWYVVGGAGIVVLDGREIEAHPGDAVDIPLGAVHRAENRSREAFVFIEIQRGDYLGEDDIVRLEDDFGRAPGD